MNAALLRLLAMLLLVAVLPACNEPAVRTGAAGAMPVASQGVAELVMMEVPAAGTKPGETADIANGLKRLLVLGLKAAAVLGVLGIVALGVLLIALRRKQTKQLPSSPPVPQNVVRKALTPQPRPSPAPAPEPPASSPGAEGEASGSIDQDATLLGVRLPLLGPAPSLLPPRPPSQSTGLVPAEEPLSTTTTGMKSTLKAIDIVPLPISAPPRVSIAMVAGWICLVMGLGLLIAVPNQVLFFAPLLAAAFLFALLTLMQGRGLQGGMQLCLLFIAAPSVWYSLPREAEHAPVPSAPRLADSAQPVPPKSAAAVDADTRPAATPATTQESPPPAASARAATPKPGPPPSTAAEPPAKGVGGASPALSRGTVSGTAADQAAGAKKPPAGAATPPATAPPASSATASPSTAPPAQSQSQAQAQAAAAVPLPPGSRWRGMCYESTGTNYSVVIDITKREGKTFEAVVYWPQINNSSTRARGSIEGVQLVFTEYALIQGADVAIPTHYRAELLPGNRIVGTFTSPVGESGSIDVQFVPPPAPPAPPPLLSYRARLSEADRFNGSGVDLRTLPGTKLNDILLQDRLHVHRGVHQDLEDAIDAIYRSKTPTEYRALFDNKPIRIPASATLEKLLRNNVVVHVRVYQEYITVEPVGGGR